MIIINSSFGQNTLSVEERAYYQEAFSYYPELKNANINIKVKNYISPFAASYSWYSLLVPKDKRKYILKVSKQSIFKLNPILLTSLNDSAKIGVFGHELAHIAFFQKANFFQFLKFIMQHLTRRGTDKAEWNTDMSAIQHGLGLYLKAWSVNVRDSLKISTWNGSTLYSKKKFSKMDKRYMSPMVIDSVMKCSKIEQ